MWKPERFYKEKPRSWQRVGITEKGFYNACYSQVKAKGIWKIELIEQPARHNTKNYPNELLERWEEVTAKLKSGGYNLCIPIVPVQCEIKPSKAIL